jgi:hypothetical protein
MASRIRDTGKLDCWDIEHWPPHVYPHTESRARYMVRVFRTELLNAGAISRVGRELVVLGGPYMRWLQRRASKVADFVPPGLNGDVKAPEQRRAA